MGQVTTWQMTEEERLAYIEKHPVKPTKKAKKKEAFENIHTDYKWRGVKANDARYKNKDL
ncbi:hypothetical protein J7E63_12990 [Bacillus sp. ISL-75]|uniref:hypothetical protein n=1 Tax=Bacillus sp. ISL-75 TaxID=2819137 RepID=UPI001BE93DAA|nr:hypothetical protein [Bacillus sp. ISL-75]MBT2727855.1 hypothetical protein [Bacillus sp. ISL-75]